MQYDKEFLLKLDKNRQKTIYARVTSLTLDELPVEQITGKVSSGSINIDGTSAVRRTCSLSMVVNLVDYNVPSWVLNTKFKLEIGVKNNIDSKYPDIIWFPQGIYLITSFNTSHSVDNFNLSIQGKDKMSLLNGDISGQISASTDFGTIQEEDSDGNWVITKLPIKTIILNLIHLYAGEPYHNIIINDLDMKGWELLEYRYDTPMYLYKQNNAQIYDNITMQGDVSCLYNQSQYTFDTLPSEAFTSLINHNLEQPNINVNGVDINIAKIQYGDAAGYRETELVYAGDLIANVGETIVSVLDKIKNMLGEFEYFYDLDGQFIFQKKRSFIEVNWDKSKDEIIKDYESGDKIYEFNNSELVISFNNNPDISKIKNDFSVWGRRPSIASSAELPVHYRYAIDQKPEQYKSIMVENDCPEIVEYNAKYNTNLAGQDSIEYNASEYDWRELIYRMALDYLKYAHILDDFSQRVATANPLNYPDGSTGYEQYYIDLQGFWRELYDPTIFDEVDDNLKNKTDDEIQKLLDTAIEEYIKITNKISTEAKNKEKEIKKYEKLLNYNREENNLYKYWNKTVYEAPELLNFWFDFLDSENSEISKYNIKNIGDRIKTLNDNKIKGIYFKDIPQVIYTEQLGNIIIGETASNISYIQIPSKVEDMFSLSARGISAKEKMDELLYEHSCMPISVTINTVPIYYLEPNTRIYIHDEKSKVDGDYIITRMSIPLNYDGNMSITAIKALNDKI